MAKQEGNFPATRWTLIRQAGHEDETTASEAMSELCTHYWKPIYTFLRANRHPPADAEDLTQGFFQHLLSHEVFQTAQSAKGRLRNFLLATLKNYLTDEHRKARAQKRGGGAVTLDIDQAEIAFALLTPDEDPALAYERHWAMALLETVLSRLRAEYETRDALESFQLLHHSISPDSKPDYADLSTKLEVPPDTVKVRVHRLRKRYATLLRNEIASTVDDPSEVDDELNHLFTLFATP